MGATINKKHQIFLKDSCETEPDEKNVSNFRIKSSMKFDSFKEKLHIG